MVSAGSCNVILRSCEMRDKIVSLDSGQKQDIAHCGNVLPQVLCLMSH